MYKDELEVSKDEVFIVTRHDLLQIVRFWARTAMSMMCIAADGGCLSQTDCDRLALACRRIDEAERVLPKAELIMAVESAVEDLRADRAVLHPWPEEKGDLACL